MKKTIKEYLETLPEPYKTAAINNVNKNIIDDYCTTMFGALNSFEWISSKEGEVYWNSLYDYLWQIECYEIAQKKLGNPLQRVKTII